MSGGSNDPVEILTDDSNDTQHSTTIQPKKEPVTTPKRKNTGAGSGGCSNNSNGNNKTSSKMVNSEPQASSSKDKEKSDEERERIADSGEDNEEEDDDNPAEYNVEAIRAKRKNRHGVDEYYIKWEGYPEAQNTWEPLENLKCPELISKFNEQEANKKRRNKAEKLGRPSMQASTSKRPRREAASASASYQATDIHESNGLFVEDDDDDFEAQTELTRKKSKGHQNKDPQPASEPAGLRGFDLNLPVEKILTASVGDDDKLYFFLKWQGRNDVELVDADLVEKRVPYALCRWYRDRLYWEPKETKEPNSTNAQ